MRTAIPSASDIREALRPLKTADLTLLAERSGVPFHTILKIKSGETVNPGIETVGKFMPHVRALRVAPTARAA